MTIKIAIVGGGAAGFFSAITAKEHYPQATVIIFEKSRHLLAKVKVSGGGRCNVTNACPSLKELSNAYPRGGKALKKPFRIFNNRHAMEWFESRGVPLVIQDDQCVFPLSQNSQSIIDCFLKETTQLGVKIEVKRKIRSITPINDQLALTFMDKTIPLQMFDKVIVATGGCTSRKGLEWLEKLHHRIQDPVPSLFTFNMPAEPVTQLMGIVVDKTLVSLPGTPFKSQGPLLITHWGMSGPAILTLSALGARMLNEKGYNCQVQVNWVNETNTTIVRTTVTGLVNDHSNKILSTVRPYFLPERLWLYLLEKKACHPPKSGGSLGKKG